MLADRTIKKLRESGTLRIGQHLPNTPPEELWLDDGQIQPASIDLTLGDIDASVSFWDDSDGYVWQLAPGQFALASTQEWVMLPPTICGRVEGKSTWGRRGLLIHAAGFIDPGFEGQITLELKNLTDWTIPIYRGVRICQIALDWMDVPSDRPYGHADLGSHYQRQRGVTGPWTY